MKVLFLLSAAAIVTAKECTRKTQDNVTPVCILQKIEAIKRQAKWNPPGEVNEYVYQGKRVFLFNANCCDQYHELYDANCNLLCAPSGGLTGKGDGKCADFATNAKFVKQVWKDER